MRQPWLGGTPTVEPSGRAEMRHGGRAPAEGIEQQAEVVVGVGEVRIRGERALVGGDRLRRATGLLEQPGEVEVRDRIARSACDGRSVVRLGARELTRVM